MEEAGGASILMTGAGTAFSIGGHGRNRIFPPPRPRMRLSNDRIVISLRPEQRETLARVRQRTFVLHLRDRVRSSFPAATGAIDDARLLDLVSARVE